MKFGVFVPIGANLQDIPRRGSRCAPAGTGLVRTTIGLLVLAGLAFQVSSAPGQEAPAETALPDEYTMKAVYLYSFGRYCQWPQSAFAGASESFVIGVLGEDPFGATIDRIAAKKTLHNRRIVVQRFAAPEDYHGPCQILFVSRSASPDQQAAVIEKVGDAPVLVVGESPGYAEQGATANFVIDGDRIRFEINIENARRARLRMDAKLLSLGIPVGARSSAPAQAAALQ